MVIQIWGNPPIIHDLMPQRRRAVAQQYIQTYSFHKNKFVSDFTNSIKTWYYEFYSFP